MTESARVYDLDGTLVRLRTDWRGAERAVKAVFDEAAVPVETDSKGVWELFSVAEAHGLGEAVERRVAEYEREGAVTSIRLPAADELESLAVPVGVCSLNCEEACRIALETHDLTDHVDVVVGRDTVAERKPDPEPLLAAVRGLEATPRETLFVGDSERDAVCADRAGTRFTYVGGRPSGH